MRCGDLPATWAALTAWFDQHDVLVLPQLYATGPLVRLDEDADPAGRLRTLIGHFAVRAVYVQHAADGGLTTVRVMAGGVVHELKMFAGWYADLLDGSLDGTVGTELTPA